DGQRLDLRQLAGQHLHVHRRRTSQRHALVRRAHPRLPGVGARVLRPRPRRTAIEAELAAAQRRDDAAPGGGAEVMASGERRAASSGSKFPGGGPARRSPLAARLLSIAPIQSALQPAGPQAESLANLWWIFFWVCTAFYIVLAAFFFAAIIR